MATQNLTDARKEYDDGPLIWVNTLFLCGSPFLATVLVPGT